MRIEPPMSSEIRLFDAIPVPDYNSEILGGAQAPT